MAQPLRLVVTFPHAAPASSLPGRFPARSGESTGRPLWSTIARAGAENGPCRLAQSR